MPLIMTDLDKKTIQGLNKRLHDFNDFVEDAIGKGYEVELRVEVRKDGTHRVQFTMKRRIGS